mmetsp:Transcript_86366/g.135091  ORF Transcript_86366/g.135091 Transcript_86366/m.135091 type:complete len:565 (-) Transcript_86366:27-1721(-)
MRTLVCQRVRHVTWTLALGPLVCYYSAIGARTNAAGIKAAMMEVTARAELRQAADAIDQSNSVTNPAPVTAIATASADSSHSLKPLSLSLQIATIGVVIVISASLAAWGENANKDGEINSHAGHSEKDESDFYRSMACLVCSLATCRLSLPILLYSWQKAPLDPVLAKFVAEDSLATATLQVAVISGLMCCVVCQRCNIVLKQLFCPVVASCACIIVEWLVLNPPSSAIFFSCPLGLLIGSGVCMHVNAMCLAMQHATNYWSLPLGLLMFAGVAHGFADLRNLHESSYASMLGSSSGIVGLYGTWALKFVSIGFMCSSQAALYASSVQKNMGRTTFGLAEYLHKGEGMVLSWKFGAAMLLQAAPICISAVLPTTTAKASLQHDMNGWEEWSLYLCLAAWAIVFPAWVTYCFPTSHQCLVTCTCMAILGVVDVLQAQMGGNIALGSPWVALTSAISLTLSIFATLAEVARDNEALRSIKQGSCSTSIDFLCCQKDNMGSPRGKHSRAWEGSCETMGNEQFCFAYPTSGSTVDNQKEAIDEDFQRHHVFKDPLAALFAPDLHDCDS